MLSYIPGTGIGLTVLEKTTKFMSLSLHELVNPSPASRTHIAPGAGRRG